MQQSNSKLLCVAKQHSLAFGLRLRFQSLGKVQNEISQKSVTFSLLRIFGQKVSSIENEQSALNQGTVKSVKIQKEFTRKCLKHGNVKNVKIFGKFGGGDLPRNFHIFNISW